MRTFRPEHRECKTLLEQDAECETPIEQHRECKTLKEKHMGCKMLTFSTYRMMNITAVKGFFVFSAAAFVASGRCWYTRQTKGGSGIRLDFFGIGCDQVVVFSLEATTRDVAAGRAVTEIA